MEHEDIRVELVIDGDSVRQAGTVDPGGQFVAQVRQDAERSLYFFSRVVMDREYLTPQLHQPVCDWLQRVPPYRKMCLLPRRHAKTSIAAHCLPIHILIQPTGANAYFPGRLGANTRILLAQETERRAMDNMRVLHHAFEANQLLRGLWPHVCWDKPDKEASKWNERAIIVRRSVEYPDPSVSVIGVGGAITGGRFDVLIKDDLISEAAANSEVVMEAAIAWHRNSRALFDDPDRSLEYLTGTKWAVRDLYSVIQEEDPTVAAMARSIIEDGEIIWPEVFSHATIARLQKEFGTMFPLLYMNQATDPSLVDFSEEIVRTYCWDGELVCFADDARDHLIPAG